jgi:hypothetical protein
VLAIRLLPMLWLLAAPVLASACSHPRMVGYLRSRRPVVVVAGVLAPAAMVTLAAAGLPHLGRPDPARYPGPAVLQAIPSGCHVFNTYVQGGLLLLQRPDLLVSMDSRNDLYGPSAVLASARALTRRDPSVVPAGAGCALLPPTSLLADALRSDSGWAVRAKDPAALLFVRR